MTTVHTGYKYRLYPTPEQEEYLNRAIGSTRKLYNLLLEGKNSNYAAYKNGEVTKDQLKTLDKELTPQYFKNQEEYSYLKEVDNTALSASWLNLNKAFQKFFNKEAGYPKFKSKNKHKWSFTSSVSNKKHPNVRISAEGLKLPKVNDLIRVVYHREVEGVVKSATVTKCRDGRWFVSIMVEQEISIPVLPLPEEVVSPVGIDLGLTSFITTDDGRTVDNPRLSRHQKKKLGREQRKLSRRMLRAKKEGRDLSESKNYQKQRTRVARLHSKVTDAKKDFLHKLSRMIVNNHDFISVEDLKVSSMVKNHRLSFSVADASWSTFLSLIEYKASRAGKHCVRVSSRYASTQLCSGCGEKTGPRGVSELGIREWECLSCGVVHDRDVNAARNILGEGWGVVFGDVYRRDDGSTSVTLVPSLVNNNDTGAIGLVGSVNSKCSQEPFISDDGSSHFFK